MKSIPPLSKRGDVSTHGSKAYQTVALSKGAGCVVPRAHELVVPRAHELGVLTLKASI